jgi:AcrR family transcriptional regulator
MEVLEDRRARKTRKAIQNAFMKLMLKKDISRITIKDISDMADINRSTFYLHYYDIYEVFEDIEKETVKTIFNKLKDYEMVKLIDNPYPLLKAILEEMDNDIDFNHFLIGSSVSSNFLDKIKKQFKKQLLDDYINEMPNTGNIEKISIAITFLSAGTIDAYEEWITENRPIPLAQFSKIVSEQISNGISIFNNNETIVK